MFRQNMFLDKYEDCIARKRRAGGDIDLWHTIKILPLDIFHIVMDKCVLNSHKILVSLVPDADPAKRRQGDFGRVSYKIGEAFDWMCEWREYFLDPSGAALVVWFRELAKFCEYAEGVGKDTSNIHKLAQTLAVRLNIADVPRQVLKEFSDSSFEVALGDLNALSDISYYSNQDECADFRNIEKLAIKLATECQTQYKDENKARDIFADWNQKLYNVPDTGVIQRNQATTALWEEFSTTVNITSNRDLRRIRPAYLTKLRQCMFLCDFPAYCGVQRWYTVVDRLTRRYKTNSRKENDKYSANHSDFWSDATRTYLNDISQRIPRIMVEAFAVIFATITPVENLDPFERARQEPSQDDKDQARQEMEDQLYAKPYEAYHGAPPGRPAKPKLRIHQTCTTNQT